MTRTADGWHSGTRTRAVADPEVADLPDVSAYPEREFVLLRYRVHRRAVSRVHPVVATTKRSTVDARRPSVRPAK